MPDRKVGELLDGLEVTLDLEDDDMVTDVVVLSKVVTADGTVTLGVGKSAATSWLEQLGLVYAAADLVRQGGYEQRDEGE